MRTLAELRAEVAAREAEEAARARAEHVAPMPVVTTPDGQPVWYPPDAILTADEVAALLRCSVKTMRRRGIPQRDGLYLFRNIVAYLSEAA